MQAVFVIAGVGGAWRCDRRSVDRPSNGVRDRHPMGPLRSTDLVGLDVRLAIAERLERMLGPRLTPPELLRQKSPAAI